MALFFALVPQYRIGLGIAIVLCIVVAVFIDNHPVLDIYDGFIVCYKGDDPERICIIPAEHLIYWSVASGNTSVVQVFFEDMDDSEQALCANVHTINSYQASNALDRYFHEKSYAEIKRQADLRKLGRSRKK